MAGRGGVMAGRHRRIVVGLAAASSLALLGDQMLYVFLPGVRRGFDRHVDSGRTGRHNHSDVIHAVIETKGLFLI